MVITVIHGLGGIGKSTLAAALAHNKQVQAHFCDGILWATLGQQPDVLSLLSGWVQALGDHNFKSPSIEATTSHLRTLLNDKAVLLIVDDAWDTKHAQAFKVGGARCHLLVTTREGVIAKVLGACTYSLDAMKPAQAMELLTKKFGRGITDAEQSNVKALAKEYGYLPLALELAADQVASGKSWVVLLQDTQQEIARLKTLDDLEASDVTDEASLKRLSLTASFSLSIKRLPEEKRKNFIWLGVLPEDTIITPAMTATLWDLDEQDAAQTLQYLLNKSLLSINSSFVTSSYGFENFEDAVAFFLPEYVKEMQRKAEFLVNEIPTYRLHDLLHDWARNLLTAPVIPKRQGDLPGLGLTLANAHAELLRKYRGKTQNGLWYTLPDDSYIHQHLAWHLEKADLMEEIHQLWHQELVETDNEWLKVREQLGQERGYMNDLRRAIDLLSSPRIRDINLITKAMKMIAKIMERESTLLNDMHENAMSSIRQIKA